MSRMLVGTKSADDRAMNRALLASLALATVVFAGCSDDEGGTTPATSDDTGLAADTGAGTTDTGSEPADSSIADSASADSGTPGDSAMDTRPGDATGPDALGADVSVDAPAELAAACIGSGGTVGTAQCCTSAGPFPNTCAIGACSCAPANSRPTAVCNCPSGKCWNGATCM